MNSNQDRRFDITWRMLFTMVVPIPLIEFGLTFSWRRGFDDTSRVVFLGTIVTSLVLVLFAKWDQISEDWFLKKLFLSLAIMQIPFLIQAGVTLHERRSERLAKEERRMDELRQRIRDSLIDDQLSDESRQALLKLTGADDDLQ